jgi:hypothetical protein
VVGVGTSSPAAASTEGRLSAARNSAAAAARMARFLGLKTPPRAVEPTAGAEPLPASATRRALAPAQVSRRTRRRGSFRRRALFVVLLS